MAPIDLGDRPGFRMAALECWASWQPRRLCRAAVLCCLPGHAPGRFRYRCSLTLEMICLVPNPR